MTADKKLADLRENLSNLGSALVAFSGGVDSSLLLKVAAEALPGKVVAAFVRSILNPAGDLENAAGLASDLGVPLVTLPFDPLVIPEIRENDPERCYHCKLALARLLLLEARRQGLAAVLEGSQADDARVYRPGRRALKESGLISPLADVGLEKEEIRTLSKALGLAAWNRPAAACLATRFPYHRTLTAEALEQVRAAEEKLVAEGFLGGRARHHGDIMRLELNPEDLARLLETELRTRLTADLTALGFKFVTLDLAGYRAGVFDH